jgi:hypothetical protein
MRSVVVLLVFLLTAGGAKAVVANSISQDLWAYWPLAGDSYDATPRQLHGTPDGAVRDDPQGGPFAGATAFEGGWIDIPGDGNPDFRSFTISAWIKFDRASTEFTPIVGRLGVEGRFRGLAYQLDDGRMVTTDIMPQWRRWAHVALVHDADDRTMTLWVNGWKTAERLLPAGSLAPAPLGGGFGFGGKSGGKPAFRGELADVLVFRRTLQETEIQTLSQGMNRMTPQQVAISQGCGGTGQQPCSVCVSYVSWPPAKWGECGPARVRWCASNQVTSQFATCP